MKTIIYHNNRCGKSRCALQALEAGGQPFEVVEYLKTPLDAAQIRELLKQLGKQPLELIRIKESVFKEHFQGKNLSEEEWIAALAAYPIILERPIVVRGNKAWLARDESGVAAI